MKTTFQIFGFVAAIFLAGCSSTRKTAKHEVANTGEIQSRIILKKNVPARNIDTRNVSAADVVAFAQTLIGIKYTYGSAIKEKGFDCSGFINYVFNHFNIAVPRVSVDFTNAGAEVPAKDSRPGDLILFTGSNENSGEVGHLGIIVENNNGDIKFIHASESRGVMVSGMNSYFLPRFVKVNRVFNVF